MVEGQPPYVLDIDVAFKYGNGYLSANDWPFLPVKIILKKTLNLITLFFN